jgi:diaminopimelate epimerase
MSVALELGKHHALGNDFLVGLGAGAASLFSDEREASQLVRGVCDRHRGLGADGVILAVAESAGWRMRLWNADGLRAETSGNGLRCLAHALVAAELAPAGEPIAVETDAGQRWAVVDRRGRLGAGGTVAVEVTMGQAKVCEPGDTAGWRGRALRVDVGNPHLVLEARDARDLHAIVELGPLLERSTPGGTNVEIVRQSGKGTLEMAVWERGVGITDACGTGSVAAAAAARAWGVLGWPVSVRNPGGELVVSESFSGGWSIPSERGEEAVLKGPATWVGTVVFTSSQLDELRLAGLAARSVS